MNLTFGIAECIKYVLLFVCKKKEVSELPIEKKGQFGKRSFTVEITQGARI